MATFQKVELSASADGRAIKIGATGSPGTLIHTAQSGTGEDKYDEVWLYFANHDTTDRLLTVQWGSTANPDDNIPVGLLPMEGLILVVPGLILQNGLSIRAYADAANVITCHGFVNRIT